jgi:hypothetical protein
MMSVLTSADDLQWLREVHLKWIELPPFQVAVLEGHEDSPYCITLYETNHVDSPCCRLYPNADGEFRRVEGMGTILLAPPSDP